MQDFARALADFVRDNQVWAAPIVMVLAFGESLAFISLLVPAWGALVAIGALIGVSGISFWPVWLAGGIGAALGDWVSYWFGYRYKEHVAEMWPLSRYPEILPRGEAFVQKWGVPSIFIGRFFGPLRASVPLAAGIFEMSYWPFQIANFVSALVWSAVLLLVGDVMAQARRMAVAGGVGQGRNKLTTRGVSPNMRNLRSIFALPSLGRRRVIAETLVDLRGNRTKGTHKAGNHREPHPSSHWEDITWN